jgi:hypothetical protein
MTQNSQSPSPVTRLSNIQVVLILLTCGTCLTIVTWFFAKDIGRIPVSLWDICTTVLPSSEKIPANQTQPKAQTLNTPQPTSPQKK